MINPTPENTLKNYLRVGFFFISYKLILKLFLCLLLAFILMFTAVSSMGFLYSLPFLDKFFTPKLYYHSRALESYSGRANILLSPGKVVYKGDIAKGKCDGLGSQYSYGTDHQKHLIYQGEFKENNYEGKGKLYKNDRLIYKGLFSKNCFEGSGVYFDSDKKSLYIGEFKNNLMEGKGTLVDLNQTEKLCIDDVEALIDEPDNKLLKDKLLTDNIKMYAGEFKNGQYYGTGKYINFHLDKNNKSQYKYIYIGDFKNGFKDGNGKLIDLSQTGNLCAKDMSDLIDQTAGKLLADKLMKYDKAIIYEGEFKNGQYNGSGKLIDKVKQTQYTGDFKNGLKDGKGKFIDLSQNKKLRIKDFEYFVEAPDTKVEPGKLLNKNNIKIFEGEFEKDIFKGNGKLTNIDDKNKITVYEGEFKDGNIFIGKIIDSVTNATISEGVFRNKELFGQGSLFDENGDQNYKGPVSGRYIDYPKLLGMSGTKLKSIFLAEAGISTAADKTLVTYKDFGLTLVLADNNTGMPVDRPDIGEDSDEDISKPDEKVNIGDSTAYVEKIILWNDVKSCKGSFNDFFAKYMTVGNQQYSGKTLINEEENEIVSLILADDSINNRAGVTPKMAEIYMRNYKAGGCSLSTYAIKETSAILFVMLEKNN